MGEYADYEIDRLMFGRFDHSNHKRKKMAYQFKKKNYNTKYYKFEGYCSYAKVYEPDEYNGNQFWKINLHPTKEVLDEIKASGSQVRVKPDNEEFSGVKGKFVTFRRDVEKKFKDEVRQFDPPAIYDKDGNGIVTYKDDQMIGEKFLIGNNSFVEVEVEVYPAGSFGKGTRLKSIRLIDPIRYDPKAKEEVPEESEREEVKPSENKTEVPEKTNKKVAW